MDALAALQRLGGGHLIEDLYFALTQVSGEVAATQKNGSVSVAFKIQPAKGDSGTVVILETIKRNPPQDGDRGALFFAIDGELHRDDPRQVHMEFRTVAGQREPRELPDDASEIRKAE